MGIYDRDYERDRPYDDAGMGLNLSGPRSLTTNLVIVMFVVYAVQLLTEPSREANHDEGWFTNMFSLYADFFRRPWQSYQLLTYGFLHDVDHIPHILFNMFNLWVFGRAVEERYGRVEYLRFFLIAIIVAGLFWASAEFVTNRELLHISLLGASGGVVAVLVLFALNFPHRRLALFGVLEMPAWVLAVMCVGIDVINALSRDTNATIAYTAHIGGAAFAAIYFKSGMRFERWIPSGDWLKRLRPGPKLRVHNPENDDDSTERQVDEILAKIQAHGQDSLTRRERKILEQASRKYQQRRK